MRIRWSALLGRWLGALILAVILAPAASAQAIKSPERPRADEAPRGAVLSGPEILDFARDLCRDSTNPRPEEFVLWQPGPADIARFEKLLPEFMRSQKAPSDYQPLHEYYRQYVGGIHKGKKKICVNFFHYCFLLDSMRVQPDLPSDYWKDEPVVVDDGGAYFFQLQFDVETGTFLKLKFNGYA